LDNYIKAIITGATGMVGEGVLHECLMHNHVESVLVIGRKSCGILHPKLREIVLDDLSDLSSVENQLSGYNACFFCSGVSSIGKNEEEYYRLTYTLTLSFAGTLSKINPDMTFCYISGSKTDSTEKGKFMWARVKGKTENDLMKLPFKKVYNFRPGYLHPTKGLKNTLAYYKYISWLYPVLHLITPGYVSKLSQLGKAMINCILFGYDKNILEVKDINLLSGKK
jgi:uncharacterized protein YbjT (DUF2867 family)